MSGGRTGLARLQRWKATNPERDRLLDRASCKRRYHANLEASRARVRAAAKKKYQENPALEIAKSNERRNRRLEANPEAIRLQWRQQTAIRRTRKSGGDAVPIDFERIRQRDRMRCHLCLKRVRESELHFDHVIPLAAGGEHVESNIAVAHGRCNLSKGAKVLSLF